jgi:hypothetical protein
MTPFERRPQKKNGPQFGRGDDRAARAPRGQSLASLPASDLGERFYAWRGASGARFVCSVFQAGETGIVADFSSALIVGVAREGALRRPVCVLSSREFEGVAGRAPWEAERALGVAEWHVHFCADEDKLCDLAASLLN